METRDTGTDGDAPALAPEERAADVWRRRADALRGARRRGHAQTAVGADAGAGADRYLVARASGQLFAFPLRSVAEVREAEPAFRECPVPDAPPAFWSLVVVRGEVRPVFDTSALLPGNPDSDPVADRDTAAPAERHIVLLRSAGDGASGESGGADLADQSVGLLVDRIEQTAEGRPESPETGAPVTHPLLAGYLAVPGSNRAVLVVDVPALQRRLRGDADRGESTQPAAPSPRDGAAAEESENR